MEVNAPSTPSFVPLSPTVPSEKWDIWRDSPLRYMGYANEIGEAFAPVYRRMLAPSYAIAIAYVLGDTYDKTLKAYISQVSAHPCAGVGTVTGTDSKEEKLSRINYSKIAIESGDTLLWQMLASVTIPGMTIKGVAKLAGMFVNHSKIKGSITQTGRLFFPTAIGLVTIPFIIEPIDMFVHSLMDSTYRSYFDNRKH